MQMRRCLDRGGAENGFSGYDSPMSQFRHSQIKETKNGHKPPVATLFEQGRKEFGYVVWHWRYSYLHISFFIFLLFLASLAVGLQKILSLLDSEDANVRIHAVKVLANLAAEGKFSPQGY